MLTPTTLTEHLRRSGHLSSGRVTAFSKGERFAAGADEVARLHLSYSSDGAGPRTLVYKMFGPAWYGVTGRSELRFYREFAPATPSVSVPTLYGWVDKPEMRTCALLLEDLTQHHKPVTPPVATATLERLMCHLAHLHARWWEHPRLESDDFMRPAATALRMAQAWSEAAVYESEQHARRAVGRFAARHAPRLSSEDLRFLGTLVESWGQQSRRRTISGDALTLLHGDPHVHGNVFIAKDDETTLKIIDWAQIGRGLGPHDVMSVLWSAGLEAQTARSRRLLRVYHGRLVHAGVANYPWEQCLQDYHLSLLTKTFQALFQDDLIAFRRLVSAARLWDGVDERVQEGS